MKWSLAIFVAAERPPAPLKAVQLDSQRLYSKAIGLGDWHFYDEVGRPWTSVGFADVHLPTTNIALKILVLSAEHWRN
jgi:hypothetical protein